MSSITLTEKAATELKRHKEGAQAGEDMFLRVKIVAGGCSGHSHRLFLDSQYDEAKDSRYKFHGEDLVVDKKSELFLDGATLDFIDGLEQRGFHLEVPGGEEELRVRELLSVLNDECPSTNDQ